MNQAGTEEKEEKKTNSCRPWGSMKVRAQRGGRGVGVSYKPSTIRNSLAMFYGNKMKPSSDAQVGDRVLQEEEEEKEEAVSLTAIRAVACFGSEHLISTGIGFVKPTKSKRG